MYLVFAPLILYTYPLVRSPLRFSQPSLGYYCRLACRLKHSALIFCISSHINFPSPFHAWPALTCTIQASHRSKRVYIYIQPPSPQPPCTTTTTTTTITTTTTTIYVLIFPYWSTFSLPIQEEYQPSSRRPRNTWGLLRMLCE